MNIRPISWQETIPLRHRVLWPDKDPEYCLVEGEEDARHFGAFRSGELVAVASVFPTDRGPQLRKFATVAEYQGQGIGSALMIHIIEEIKRLDVPCFWCDARESAQGFYERFGMKVEGKRFYKYNIPHIRLSLSLK